MFKNMEESRKKTQEDKDVNDIIVKYQKNKEKFPQLTIDNFIKHSIEVCLKNNENLPKDKLEIKLNYLEKF